VSETLESEIAALPNNCAEGNSYALTVHSLQLQRSRPGCIHRMLER
jgi:hypothetical protein